MREETYTNIGFSPQKCFFANSMSPVDPPSNRVPLDVLAQHAYDRMHRHRSVDRSIDNVSIVSSLGESFLYGVEDCPRDPPELSTNPNKQIFSHRSGLATECETESVQIQQSGVASKKATISMERRRPSASIPHWVRSISIVSVILFVLAGILTAVALISNTNKSSSNNKQQSTDVKAPTDYWVTRESSPITSAPSFQPSCRPVASLLSTAESLPPSSQPTQRPSTAPTLRPSSTSKEKGNKDKD